MTTTDDLIARAQAVLDAAEKMTPGPWKSRGVMIDPAIACIPHRPSMYTLGRTDESTPADDARADADATGIATLRNDAPAVIRDLIAAVASARAVATEAIDALETAASWDGYQAIGAIKVTIGGSTQYLVNAADAIATLRARLADQARGLTVGAALADPRVQAGTHVVEYNDEGAWRAWRQLRSGKRESLSTRAFIQGFRGSPPERTMAWLAWMSTSVDNLDGAEVWTEEYAQPCRLVPLADADRDPTERGPL